MQNLAGLKKIIQRTIDLHVHIGPEIIPRKFDVKSLSTTESKKLGGAVLKNHFYPTSPLIDSMTGDFVLFGSLCLNNFVGGINPEAVYSASLVTTHPFVVWFPTINAQQFLKNSAYEIAPEWILKSDFLARATSAISGITILDGKGQLNSDAVRVVRVIKQTNAILATGHISWQESIELVKAASVIGVKKIIITHPIYQKIAMPISVQKQLTGYGAKIEQSFSMYSIDKIAIKKIAAQIKEVGANNVVLSSDVGQTFSPSPSNALYEFGEKLLQYKITMEELNTMMVTNPRQLVGLT